MLLSQFIWPKAFALPALSRIMCLHLPFSMWPSKQIFMSRHGNAFPVPQAGSGQLNDERLSDSFWATIQQESIGLSRFAPFSSLHVFSGQYRYLVIINPLYRRFYCQGYCLGYQRWSSRWSSRWSRCNYARFLSWIMVWMNKSSLRGDYTFCILK